MRSQHSFSRWAGWAAIVSGPLAVASVVFLFLPVDFDFEAFGDAGHLLSLPASRVTVVRWGLLLDLLGYYLLLAPLALATRDLVPGEHRGWGRLASWCGTSYALVGAIGAAGLAAVLLPLADAYSATSAAAEHAALEAVYTALSHLVVDGMWNTLEVLLAVVWFAVVGVALRDRHRGASRLSLVLAAATLLDTVGNFVGSEAIASVGLNLYLVGAPVWAVVMGVVLLRRVRIAAGRGETAPVVPGVGA